VLQDLLPLLAALAVAALLYILRERRRRRLWLSPARPDLTMAETCDLWRRGHRGWTDHAFHPPEAAAGASPAEVEEEARRGLFETEKAILRSDHPRLAARRAILESAILALHLEAVAALGEAERTALLSGYAEGMDGVLRTAWRICELRWALLRIYAGLKFDDAAPGDWFHHFLWIARPYIREKVRLAQEHVLRMDAGSGRFVEVYDQLLDQLRKEMLKARPKQRFVEPDL
jgi:hypothetical protein